MISSDVQPLPLGVIVMRTWTTNTGPSGLGSGGDLGRVKLSQVGNLSVDIAQ